MLAASVQDNPSEWEIVCHHPSLGLDYRPILIWVLAPIPVVL